MTEKYIQAIVAAVVAAIKPLIGIRPEWLNESQAARYLGVSATTLRGRRAEFRARLLGKRWKYHRDDLDRALKSPWMTGRRG